VPSVTERRLSVWCGSKIENLPKHAAEEPQRFLGRLDARVLLQLCGPLIRGFSKPLSHTGLASTHGLCQRAQ
jgi:hypothetical protein